MSSEGAWGALCPLSRCAVQWGLLLQMLWYLKLLWQTQLLQNKWCSLKSPHVNCSPPLELAWPQLIYTSTRREDDGPFNPPSEGLWPVSSTQ